MLCPKCRQCEMRVMGRRVQRTVDGKLREKAMLLCPKKECSHREERWISKSEQEG